MLQLLDRHSRRLVATMVAGLRERLSAFRHAQAGTGRRLALLHEEHGAVVEALLASDGPAAYVAMCNHDARLSTRVLERPRDARYERATEASRATPTTTA